MLDQSTQEDEDSVVDSSSIGSLSSPSTLVNTPIDHSLLDAQEHSEGHEIRYTQIEETAHVVQNLIEDLAASGSTSMVQEALLSTEMAAHQQTRDELAQIKAQVTAKDSQLRTSQRLLVQATRSHMQLRGIRTNPQTQLDKANSEISLLEVRIDALRTEVTRISEKLAKQNDLIRKGSKFFIRPGTRLFARLNKAEKLLKGALGRADRLMHLAERRLPISAPAGRHFGDIVDKDVDANQDVEPKIQLAIEGPPADFSVMQNAETVSGYEEMLDEIDTEQLIPDIFDVQDGTAVHNGNVANIGAEGPVFDNSDFQKAEDAASSRVPPAICQDTTKKPAVRGSLFAIGTSKQVNEPEVYDTANKSEFTLSPGSPAHKARQETENTAKEPVFTFSGTPAQESQQKAKGTAKKPLFQISAAYAQKPRQGVPSGVTTSPQDSRLAQQAAARVVSGMQAPEEIAEDEAEWIDVEDENIDDEENVQKGAAELMLGKYQVTCGQTSADQRDAPKAEEKAQDFTFGVTAPLFGAQTNPNPVQNNNADSGRFNFASATDFNFGTTSAFDASSTLFTARSKTFGDAEEDEQKEGPTKKTRTDPIFKAASSFNVSSPSSGSKEGETKKTKTASVFDAAASINLSSATFDNKGVIGRSVDHDLEAASETSRIDEAEQKEGPAKKTTMAPIFEAAAYINMSYSSSGSKEEATKKTKTASVLDTAASVDLSSATFDNKGVIGRSVDHDLKGTSETSRITFMSDLLFSETAAKGEGEKQEPASETKTPSMSRAGTSNKFSFSPSGVMPSFGGFKKGTVGSFNVPSDPNPIQAGDKDKQKEGPTKKAAKAPLFTAEAFAKFGSPASSGNDKAEQFEFGTTGAFKPTHSSTSTIEARLPALSVSSNSPQPVQPAPTAASGLQNGGDRPRSEDQLVGKNDEGELQKVTGTLSDEVLRMSSASPSASDSRVEGAANVLGNLGFDAATLTCIVNSVSPAVHKNPGGEDHSESLISRGAISASQFKACKATRDVWQGSGRTSAEITASWELECRERAASTLTDGVNGQNPPPTSIPWREPEWPATLPPLGGPEPGWSAERLPLTATPTRTSTTPQSPNSTQATASSLGGNCGKILTVPPVISKIVAHMLETAPMTLRNADGHSNLIVVGAIEEGIRYAMDVIDGLHIGPPTPPAIMVKFDTEVHFLSGDWVARRFTIRRAMQREADDIQKEIEIKGESLTRIEGAPETEVTIENERHVEHKITIPSEPLETTLSPMDMRDVGRILTARRSGRVASVIGQRERSAVREDVRGDESQVKEPPAPNPPEIGNGEASMIRAGKAQEAMGNCGQERSAELEGAMRNEPQETRSATRSNVGVELQMGLQMAPRMRPRIVPQRRPQMAPQMRPQMSLQMEMQMGLQKDDTATSETQTPSSTAETGHESREQTKDTTPKEASGGLCIWSLRKRR